MADYYTKKLQREWAYCQKCEGLHQCQYTPIGNTGFRPIWQQWNPLYSYVAECRHKTAATTKARIDRLFGNSGIPIIHRDKKFRDLKPSQALMWAIKLVNDKLNGLYIYGNNTTELVSAVGNELILKGTDILYTTALSMTTKLRANNPDYYAALKTLTSATALIVEDLQPSNRYNEEQITLVIEERLRIGLKTIVTSTKPIAKLEVNTSLINQLKQLSEVGIQ